MFVRRVAPALALVVLSAACSATSPRLSADEYYSTGKTAFDSENYEVAIRSYKDLLDQYPFDPHAEEVRSPSPSHY
jgi:outer membrane protein assembly factor BamD (BamD/ComL family)